MNVLYFYQQRINKIKKNIYACWNPYDKKLT